MGREQRFRQELPPQPLPPPDSAKQVMITGYVDCGKDEAGKQSIIFFPICRRIDIEVDASGNEIVTLTVENLTQWTLDAAQSKEFLYNVNMRERPAPSGLIIPDIARRRLV